MKITKHPISDFLLIVETEGHEDMAAGLGVTKERSKELLTAMMQTNIAVSKDGQANAVMFLNIMSAVCVNANEIAYVAFVLGTKYNPKS